MKRINKTKLFIMVWATMAFTTVLAAPPELAEAVPSEGLPPISEAELAGLRGGFLVADGITLDFAATVRTYLDGVLALQTSLAWTPEGAKTASALGEGATTATAETLKAAGVDIGSVVKPQDSLAISDTGATVLLHRASIDGVQNFVFNNASNQDIRQQVDVTLVLPGFEAIQQDMARGLFGLRWDDDLGASTIDAATR